MSGRMCSVKSVCFCLAVGFLSCFVSMQMNAQETRLSVPQGGSGNESAAELPESPQPLTALAEMPAAFGQPGTQQSGSSTASAQQPANTTQQTPQQKSDYERAEEQLKIEEKQRVVGIVPEFNTSYDSQAVSLSAGQKMRLAWRTVTDPEPFGVAFLTGAYHEINDGNRVLKPGSSTIYIRENGTGFEWGPAGYFERVGAGYLDAFDGTMWGNAFLPILLHQDPRFFRMGHGSYLKRTLYAASTSFICKGDKTRRWEPNYSNVVGNVIAGEISNFYYPAGTPTKIGFTIQTAMIQTFEGSAGSVFQEFWPDLSRHFLHKDPTHGQDALWQKEHEEALQKKNQQN